jgi:hypothetical protein
MMDSTYSKEFAERHKTAIKNKKIQYSKRNIPSDSQQYSCMDVLVDGGKVYHCFVCPDKEVLVLDGCTRHK